MWRSYLMSGFTTRSYIFTKSNRSSNVFHPKKQAIDSVHPIRYAWWRHQMETYSVVLDLCAGNSPVTGEFPARRPVTRSFDVFFDLRLNTRLSKQSWGWWFERLLRSSWRHCNCYLTLYLLGPLVNKKLLLLMVHRFFGLFCWGSIYFLMDPYKIFTYIL